MLLTVVLYFWHFNFFFHWEVVCRWTIYSFQDKAPQSALMQDNYFSVVSSLSVFILFSTIHAFSADHVDFRKAFWDMSECFDQGSISFSLYLSFLKISHSKNIYIYFYLLHSSPSPSIHFVVVNNIMIFRLLR